MNQKKIIIRNIFSNWTGYLVSVVIGFIISPVIVHSLGNNLYGVWSIVVSFSGYYGLINLGITPAVSYYLSYHYGKGEYERINRVSSTAFVVLILMSFAVLSISLAVGYLGTSIFHIDTQHVSDFKLTVFIMALNFSFGLAFAVFQSLLVMLQRYDLRNAAQIIFDILRTILIYLALKKGYGIVAISVITTFFTFCTNISFAVIIHRIFPMAKIGFSYFSKATLSSIFGYGFFAIISELGRQLIFFSYAFVIGIFVNTALITFFAIAGNLVQYARNFVGSMARVFFPVAAQQYSRLEFEKLRDLCLKGSQYAFLSSVLVIVGFVTMGKQFIILWMGKEFIKSYSILMILCVGYIPFFLSYIPTQILLGAKKISFIAMVNGIAAFVNILISVLLIKNMGIVGVAWGTSISLCLQSLMIIFNCCKILDMPIGVFFIQVVLKSTLCSIPVVILGLFFQHKYFAESWPLLIIQIAILSILYFVFGACVFIDKKKCQDLIYVFVNRFR